MATERFVRKLAAILAADVAGYSRLMDRGEEATLRQLKSHRAVIDALINEHRGRIFGSAGDSVIAEFSSAIDVVSCAISIQRAIFERNANLTGGEQMDFRIGVHLGDVMIEGDNLFGDAVNLAARLEGLSEPGGICVSEEIFRQVRKNLDIEFADLGRKHVKNISEAIRVYRIITRFGATNGSVAVTDRASPAATATSQEDHQTDNTRAADRVLVVDDDPQVRELLQDYLSEYGYDVSEADSANSMRAELTRRVPDVVLLDVGLPGEDGLSLARYLRERFDIGIIMISGAGEPLDRIVGLEVGADDYVAKPFDPRELRARMKRVVGRYQERSRAKETQPPQSPTAAPCRIPIGACSLDLEAHQLFAANGQEIPLTCMEYDLLKVFAEHPNRPLSRNQLLDLTLDRDWDPNDRSIDIRIARLRRKIEPDSEEPRFIKTVRGIGYMFVQKKLE